MKNIFKKSLFLAALAAMSFTCAGPDPLEPPTPDDSEDNGSNGGEVPEVVVPSLSVSVTSADQVSAEIAVDAKNIQDFAWIVSNEPQELAPEVLYKQAEDDGTTAEGTTTSVKIEGLDADKTYYAYFAARVDNTKYYDEVVELQIQTLGYEFTDLLTVVEKELMGYSVRVTVPESVRTEPEKYGIRFSFGSLCDVLDAKYGMGETWAANLINNGHNCMGWQETQKDTTVVINPWNENRLDENGNTVYDESNGEAIPLHSPIAPGEPYIFIAAEYRYGDIAETGWGWTYGSPAKDMGYFIPLWDEARWVAEKGPTPRREHMSLDVNNGVFLSGEEEYWSGAIQPLFFRTALPAELDADFEIRIENTTAVDTDIKFIPGDDVYCYSYFICDDATYNGIISEYLLGHEEWMQWFVCSYFAMRTLQVPTISGPLSFNTLDSEYGLGNYLAQENLYHVLVTATSDQTGAAQKFIHETFTTKTKELEAPVVKVTAVEDGQNEYFAKFNIKAPNKDLVKAAYGANYKRDFIVEHNSGTSYDELAQNAFSAEELAEINSDKGLEIWINSTDGQTTRCVVVGYNRENTRNSVWSPEKVGPCDAVADCSTKLLDLVPKINSPLFDQLEGVWTATAKMMVREYDSNNTLQEYQTTAKAKINIMNSYEAPKLTQDVYDLYETFGKNKEYVDALYEDLKREIEIFNKYRLVYRNRLLCTGWFDYDFYSPSRLSFRDPFGLFTDEEYSCVDNAQIMYDFGPKWYLEIAKDGTVTLPFDQWETPPMVNWQGTPFFMSAYANKDGKTTLNHGYKSEVVKKTTNEVFMPGEFPVEVVSKDKIIIKSVKAALDTTAATLADAKLYNHYPNAIGGWSAYDAQLIRPVVSEITLTRGWNETSTSLALRVRRNYVERIDITGEDVKKVIYKSMTQMPERIDFSAGRRVRPIFFPTDEAYRKACPNAPLK